MILCGLILSFYTVCIADRGSGSGVTNSSDCVNGSVQLVHVDGWTGYDLRDERRCVKMKSGDYL